MRRRRVGRLSAGLAVAVCLAACASSTGGLGAVDGRSYVSVEVHGRELVDGTPVRLSFADGAVHASAGCNSMGGDVVVDGGVLRVRGDGLWMTEMGCPEPGWHEQDAWLMGLLAAEPTLHLEGHTLTIEHDATRLVLTQE